MNYSKDFILNAAAKQGFNIVDYPTDVVGRFVLCVLKEIMVRTLPDALSHCFKSISVIKR